MKVNKVLICLVTLVISLLICSGTLAFSKKMFSAEDVNVYENPEKHSKVILNIEKAYEVEIIDDCNDWYKVRFNSKEGYVEKVYFADEDPMIAEIDIKKLTFGTLAPQKTKSEEEIPITLFHDRELTVPIYLIDFFPSPQRVVILENGRKAKKIAICGYEAYVPAKNITSLSRKYDKKRDYNALEQYVLTLRANDYRSIWKSDPYYGNLGYSGALQKCIIYYKKGKIPDFSSKPQFQLAECNFSRFDFDDAIKKIESVAEKYNFTKYDYLIKVIEKDFIIDVAFLRDTAFMQSEKFYLDLIRAGVDSKIFVLSYFVV